MALGVLFSVWAAPCTAWPTWGCGMLVPGPPLEADAAGTQPGCLHPPLPGWQAEVGTRGVRQMSWCSGEVKREAGNLSDKPQQAKLALARGKRLSCNFSLCLKPQPLCTGKKSPTSAPSTWEGADKKNSTFTHYSCNSTFTEGLYYTTQTRCHREFGGLQSTGVMLKI